MMRKIVRFDQIYQINKRSTTQMAQRETDVLSQSELALIIG